MKIYNDNTEIDNKLPSVVTIGTFDGIHAGHQHLFNVLKKTSEKLGMRNFLVTFRPHPRTVVSKEYEIRLLTVYEEKIKIFKELNLDNLFVINFTSEFASIEYSRFIREFIVDKLNAKHIVIGYDHKFGKNRDGDLTKLKELGEKYNFEVTPVGAVEIDGEVISSSKIRNLLAEGDINKAAEFLGRNYSITGRVVRGYGRGRTLGIPTANLVCEGELKMLPKSGVYVILSKLPEKKFFGILNIGFRPTFGDEKDISVEAHFFNFTGDLYGQEIEIEFLERIRDEMKFKTVEELKNRIESDRKTAEKFIIQLNN